MKVLKILLWATLIILVLCLVGCTTHPWFKSNFPWEDKPDPNQQPVLTTSSEEVFQSGRPSWAPLLEDCLKQGGSREDCINQLPPEELKKFRAWQEKHFEKIPASRP